MPLHPYHVNYREGEAGNVSTGRDLLSLPEEFGSHCVEAMPVVQQHRMSHNSQMIFATYQSRVAWLRPRNYHERFFQGSSSIDGLKKLFPKFSRWF